MNTQFVGSHYVLAAMPIWASSLVLYGATLGVIFVVRDIFEGMPYQVAYSAQIGDALLVGAVLVAATILQRGEVMPSWLSSWLFHLPAALISVGLGLTWWWLDRPAHWGDVYHHLCVAPLFMYLAITLLPVILTKGTRVEILFVTCFVLVWASLMVFDVRHERMNQRQWLQDHGVTLRQ